ncbi:unnamed protein product [Anisakis simplex]|uniref:DUF202 domain-containing protein n=1 Tax=Anisakis simplex TaxID=6269 RepID=A0A0M3J6I3_ANISI|nr:unnamed protein product [Anisakis simplex]
MYPTLAARAIFVAFVQAFGVSTVVRPNATTSIHTTHLVNEDGQWKPASQRENRHRATTDEPSVALRLVFLTFLMIFISIFVFYTIYLVVRCVRSRVDVFRTTSAIKAIQNLEVTSMTITGVIVWLIGELENILR